jgi:restriction endonuclease S subunit
MKEPVKLAELNRSDRSSELPSTLLSELIKEIQTCLSAYDAFFVDTLPRLFSNCEGKVVNLDGAVGYCDSTFDLICASIPFGAGPTYNKDLENTEKFPGGWALIAHLLNHLRPDGIGIFLVEPHAFTTGKGKKFRDDLNRKGFFINAYINLPSGILLPHTQLQPILAIISRKETKDLYLAELEENGSAPVIARNLLSRTDTQSIRYGMISQDKFSGFDRLRAEHSISKLETQYKSFSEAKLRDVALEINSIKSGERHQERPNAIYFPKVGNSKVISDLDDATIKHQNYYQVVLDDSVDSRYASLFFESALGQLIKKSSTNQSYIGSISKSTLSDAFIAIPGKEEQREIIEFHGKLKILSKRIDEYLKDLSVNPQGTNAMHAQIDSMLLAIESLSKEDHIRSLIREGESKVVEFKETFSLCLRRKTKEKDIEESALKTIVAFLNSDGGTLIVGVSDDGSISGLGVEIEKFYKGVDDGLLKHVKNSIKNRIGEQYYPFISYAMLEIGGSKVLVFDCASSNTPCFLDENVFYVRTNPATDKLEGRKLSEYLKNHFRD